MKFEADGGKLRIVPEGTSETAWVETLKASARKVKPGSEKFVVAAYHAWLRGSVPPAQAKAQAEAEERRRTKADIARRKAFDAAGDWRLHRQDPEERRIYGSILVKAVNELCQLTCTPVPWDAEDNRLAREEAAANFIDG